MPEFRLDILRGSPLHEVVRVAREIGLYLRSGSSKEEVIDAVYRELESRWGPEEEAAPRPTLYTQRNFKDEEEALLKLPMKELRTIAEIEGAELGKLRKKFDIVQAIVAAGKAKLYAAGGSNDPALPQLRDWLQGTETGMPEKKSETNLQRAEGQESARIRRIREQNAQ